MRVSRAQAEANRQNVINVASRLFRECGFDGIGLSDLMNGAGLTQGAFYKQFESKEDLAAQAGGRAMEMSTHTWSGFAATKPEDPLEALVAFYLSTEHRDQIGEGCPFVALGADAARCGPVVREAFEAGIKKHLEVLEGVMKTSSPEDVRGRSLAIMSTMVGALMLSRIVNDDVLSRDFLNAAAGHIRGRTLK